MKKVFPSPEAVSLWRHSTILGDTLRGTKGVMLDMYRRPDTLLKACEKLLPLAVENGVNSAEKNGRPVCLHPSP